MDVRSAERLARSLRERREEADLYRLLARLRTDAPIEEALDDLRWRGARRSELLALGSEIGEEDVPRSVWVWRGEASAS